jgi:hypothetical protein
MEQIIQAIMQLLGTNSGGGELSVWALVAIVVMGAIRGAAATASKHVSDERLGEMSPVVNWLGGNTKKAANQ